MSFFKQSKVRTTLILVLSAITSMQLAVVLSIRDPRFIGVFSNRVSWNGSEFSGNIIECTQLPLCFRFGSSIIGNALIGIARAFNGIYRWDLSAFREVSVIDQRNFLLFLISAIFRMAALGVCFILLRKLLGSILSSLFVANVFLFILSGQLIIWVSRLITSSGLLIGNESSTERLVDGLNKFPVVFLLNYDYSALAVAVTLVLFLTSFDILSISVSQKIVIGLLVTTIFENLGIVFFIALIWVGKQYGIKTPFRNALPALIGAVLPVGFIIGGTLIRGSSGKGGIGYMLSMYGYFMRKNLEASGSLIISLSLLLGLPVIFGFTTGKILRIMRRIPTVFDRRAKLGLEGVMLGLGFTYLVGLFASGLSAEAGRQTLSLQFLILLYSTLRSGSTKSQEQLI